MIRIYHRLKHISVIQAVICLVILTATIGIAKFYSNSNVWKAITIMVTEEGQSIGTQNTWIEQQVHTDDEIVNNSGKVIARVTDVQSTSINNRKDILISLYAEVNQDNRSKELTFQNQPLLTTNPIELTINHTLINGTITSIGDKKQTQSSVIRVIIRYPNAQQWEIDNIHLGDYIPQNQQDKLIEIKNILIEKPSYLYSSTFNNERGSSVFISENYAIKKDVVIELAVKAEKINGVWYLLNTYPLRTGEAISLDFPQITIKNATIQSVDYGNSN